MKPYKIIPVKSQDEWNTAIKQLPNYHFLQTWQWGEIKSSNGWKPHRLLVQEKNKNLAAFQLLTKKVNSKLPITIGYAPKGPVFAVANVNLERLLLTIELAAKNRGCAYVKVDADMDETSTGGKAWKQALTNSEWLYSTQQVQTKNTGMTDLLQGDPEGEEKLLANMKKTWRYNIRSSLKRGVTIREGSAKGVPIFYELYKTTGKRKGFGIRGPEYFKAVYSIFHGGEDTDSMLLFSEHKDEQKPLSSAMFIRFNEKVWYFYAASSTRRRADMPNYPMQWEALKWARASGAKVYDWGGASTDENDPNDRMATVWHFKKGFGAEFFSSVGAWDKPIDTPKWYLLLLLTRLKKIFRR